MIRNIIILLFFITFLSLRAQERSLVFEEPYQTPFDSVSISNINSFYYNNYGIDVSLWQGNIDWESLKKEKIGFCFIKSTGGLKTDPNFYSNWNNCPFPKGAYHFFNPLINGTLQAKHLLNVVDIQKGNLPFVIDMEYTSYYRRIHPRFIAHNLMLMLNYIEKTTGIKPIIYTNASFWNKYLHPWFNNRESNYLLWVANYKVNKPLLPKGWEYWTFWQFSDRGTFVCSKNCFDLNLFRGNCINAILVK